MKQQQILKIYFGYGQKVARSGLWNKLWRTSLGDHLLKKAKQLGIRQALIIPAKAGYISEQNISHHLSEIPFDGHPVYLELVDHPEKLHAFLEENQHDLQIVASILINDGIYKSFGYEMRAKCETNRKDK